MAPAPKSCPAEKKLNGFIIFMVPVLVIVVLVVITSTWQSWPVTRWIQTVREHLRGSFLVRFVNTGCRFLSESIDFALPGILPTTTAAIQRVWAYITSKIRPSAAPLELAPAHPTNVPAHPHSRQGLPEASAVFAQTVNHGLGTSQTERSELANGSLPPNDDQASYSRSDTESRTATSIQVERQVRVQYAVDQTNCASTSQTQTATEAAVEIRDRRSLHREGTVRHRASSKGELSAPRIGLSGCYTGSPLRRSTYPEEKINVAN